jgi:FkbM family methyltransferase
MQIIKEAFMFPEFFSSRSFVKKGDVVLDIGASMGVTSIYFSEFAGVEGRVFAFEPVTYSVIERNVKENNIKNIEVVDKGVSSQTGETEIEISDYFTQKDSTKTIKQSKLYR